MPARPLIGAELRAIGLKSPPRTNVRAAQNPTTTPKAPPANAAPPLPINRPRATGLYVCDDCGQSWRIERAGGTFTTEPGRFCPSCGTDRLLSTTTSFAGLDAGAFSKDLQVERMLAQLMYQQWAANQHHEQDKHPRFVDYLKEQLA